MSVEIKKHKKHKGMYYLEWEDGTKTLDFYNISRAKEIRRNPESYAELSKSTEDED